MTRARRYSIFPRRSPKTLGGILGRAAHELGHAQQTRKVTSPALPFCAGADGQYWFIPGWILIIAGLLLSYAGMAWA